MTCFALITEGITDQVVIEALLYGHLGADIDVNPIQPMRDATDRSRQHEDTFGGWERVFEHCTADKFAEILSVNDYIVIQIDTDVGEHPHFGLALSKNGQDRAVQALCDSVRAIVAGKLGPYFYAQFQPRILFAIAVHSLECWLLPLYAQTPAEARKITGCATLLNKVVVRANQTYAKEYRIYETLCKSFKKAENIKKCCKNNESLAIFLNSLPANECRKRPL